MGENIEKLKRELERLRKKLNQITQAKFDERTYRAIQKKYRKMVSEMGKSRAEKVREITVAGRITPELDFRLRKFCVETKQPISEVIEKALKEYLGVE